MDKLKIKKLSEVCIINPKKSELGKFNNELKVSFVPMNLLIEDNQNFSSNIIKPLIEVYKGYTYFQNNDVVLAKVTPCFENGKLGIATNLENNIGFGSSEFHILRPKETVSSKWIYYSLKTSSFIHLAKLSMTGAGGLKRVPTKFIEDWSIFVPSPTEQNKIVKKLDTIFEKIDNSITLLEDNLNYSKALINSSLDGEFSALELKYRKKTLAEIVTVINGRAYKQSEMFNAGKYPILRVGNFFSNRGWYYSNMELEENKYCEKGDLLYAWSASFGPKIWDGEKSIYHYHIWKLVPLSDNVSKKFLYYLLERDTDKIKEEGGRGVGMIHITKGNIEKRMMVLPPLDVQEQTVSRIEKLYNLHEKMTKELKIKLDNMKALKSSLLDQAFKGEL
ncbi:restriction endonuclease subunit S [Elizabethkingia anophelis]|uniref:Type I restriction enzyme S subunit n=1 Tax=Flavobacterium lindanitolerans TaxID=428988 RepID=A0A497U8E6_9FLAO|nr:MULTISPECIES: restriction endonuclease subunit S [Flavobacteriales]ELB0066887.1 restriction endonuclease subunit S [Elizabethkingia anophelis]ELB1891581.1 restriction endonuclease subunit S [Elizabethkingia anophelis]MDV2442311.1 restriction endonuclease subunit S [Elizabethkingia anophelis]MDV3893445.1 restriction endonuclease subunit S [Elizabethkingia anophelis]MDV3915778.1 restriction endonuclease subunit S [Elizabethkingia anophelis]